MSTGERCHCHSDSLTRTPQVTLSLREGLEETVQDITHSCKLLGNTEEHMNSVYTVYIYIYI